MKAKKALKRLDKVVAMLSDVIEEYARSDRDARNMLDAAKASVVRAKAAVTASASPKTATKARVTAKPTTRKRVKAAAKKKLSAPVKKRGAKAKSKGVHARKKTSVVKKIKPESVMAAGTPAAAADASNASSGELAAR